jgi:hypothetical protein
MSQPTQGSEIMHDPEFGSYIINDTDIDDSEVIKALQGQNPELAALVRWGQGTQRQGSMFERDVYVTPRDIFAQMELARYASLHDDVVSGIIDSTEALAFGKIDMEAEDEDEEDIWNQIAADIDLDSRMREMWREEFTYSQFYAAVFWGTKSYKVRGKSEKGVTRKKPFENMRVPMGITMLDPMKVIPVGSMMFNKERLAYIADPNEDDSFADVILGKVSDPTIRQLVDKKYTPSPEERKWLAELLPSGGSIDRLYLLDEKNVFRHTATRPQYKRFADVRMESIFELLDLKHQLRAMDRAHLIGGTNFIILVTKGSDTLPAKPEEIMNLQAQVRTVARVPVIVGDHRLKVEIVTPKLDATLQPEKYNGLDARITSRLYHMFMTGNFSAGAKGDDSIKLARVVARGLQARRHMLRRTVEKHILRPTMEANEKFTSNAKLCFHPKRIDLDFDPAFANYILDLRDRGDLSRESVLDEVDFNQSDEARKRENEKEKYDKIFAPVNVPVPGANPGVNPSAAPVDPKAAGRRGGGTRSGGGAAPGTGQGQPPTDPRNTSK